MALAVPLVHGAGILGISQMHCWVWVACLFYMGFLCCSSSSHSLKNCAKVAVEMQPGPCCPSGTRGGTIGDIPNELLGLGCLYVWFMWGSSVVVV